MRRTLAAVLSSVLLSLAFASYAHAQADAAAPPQAQAGDNTPAKAELNAGARAYRDGRFAEAEQHFRRAYELDPTHKDAQLFIARSVQQQYKPGDASPENVATGERAVEAYQEILNRDPQNEDAYKAVVFLYGQMKRDDKVNELLTQRAGDYSVPDEKRAEALVILASKQWQCSYDITERMKGRAKEPGQDGALAPSHPAPDPADVLKARQCADEGLRLVEQAVSLSPNGASAWAYRANLLREHAKLARSEGDSEREADYERQYGEALDTQKRLAAEEEERKKRESQMAAAAAPAQTPAPAATPERKPKFSGGSFAVLNSKAVSKPEPEYPAAAKAARVQGSVSVFVSVDASGNVTEAEAVSGHPLLRDAAVAAARRAKFSQTLLSGRPVGFKGIVTYNFVLR